MEENFKYFELRKRKFYLFEGIAAVLIFGFPLVMARIYGKLQEAGILYLIVEGSVVLLGFLLIMYYINWRIIGSEEGYAVYNLFGKGRFNYYTDIVEIRKKGDAYLIVYPHDRVRINKYTNGGYWFINYCNKKYRQAHGGRSIPLRLPKRKKNKWDPFGGRIQRPVLFILYTVFVACFFIAMCIGAITSNMWSEHPGRFVFTFVLAAFWLFMMLSTLKRLVSAKKVKPPEPEEEKPCEDPVEEHYRQEDTIAREDELITPPWRETEEETESGSETGDGAENGENPQNKPPEDGSNGDGSN